MSNKTDTDKSFETLDVLFGLVYGDAESGNEESDPIPPVAVAVTDGCDVCSNIKTWKDIANISQEKVGDCLVKFKRGSYKIFATSDDWPYNRTLTIETNFCPKCGRRLND